MRGKWKYAAEEDGEVGAVYLKLQEGSVCETVEAGEGVFVDLDLNGEPLGVEFLL